jgi:hypothetical protein
MEDTGFAVILVDPRPPDLPLNPDLPRYSRRAIHKGYRGTRVGDADTQRLVLQAIAGVDAGRREIYTRLIRATASPAVRRALEELMATVFRDEFVDGLLDQGRAAGEAAMLLRVLAARGFTVPDDIRQRVQSCTDLAQLEAWGDQAVTAGSLEELFTT